jgi:hypothetical protein
VPNSMPQRQRFNAHAGLDWGGVWAAFESDGALIVEDFLEPDLLHRLNEEMGSLVAVQWGKLGSGPAFVWLSLLRPEAWREAWFGQLLRRFSSAVAR